MPLEALFCLLLGLSHDLACLPLLSDSTPTLVFLGFLPLTYLGRLIQSSFSTSLQNKPRGPLLFQGFLLHPAGTDFGEQGSRWRYKQPREKAPECLVFVLAPGFCFSLVISESMKPILNLIFLRLPFLRSQRLLLQHPPSVQSEGMNMDRKSDRCVFHVIRSPSILKHPHVIVSLSLSGITLLVIFLSEPTGSDLDR